MQIAINELSKIYPNNHQALKDVSLNIENGMFGLLGPNGAGKTTLMRILVTLLKPSHGSVRYDDWNLYTDRRFIRAVLGYLPQDFSFFSKLTTWEFLEYVAGLAGLRNKQERSKAVDQMLESVGLYEVRNRMANKLSGGMKRRLGIAQALIGDPKIVVVDEPTTGLDPEERIRFRNLLSDMSQKDMVIILSTHIVGDISSTCRNMALLNNGEVVYQGAPDQLIEDAKNHVFQIQCLDTELEQLKQTYPVITTVPADNGWDVQVVADKLNGFSGTVIEPNLEHAYVYFMRYKQNQEWIENEG